LGDLDHDGNLDIVTADSDGEVSVLLADGKGGFNVSAVATLGSNPRSVALGDVNGDGNLDIVTANFGSDNVSVLLGDGKGNFAAAPIVPGFLPDPPWVALGDVDGDGKLDIVTAEVDFGSGAKVSVLLNDGAGGFTATTVPLGTSSTQQLALGDVNHDGRLDIVTANGFNQSSSVLLGNGNGTFTVHAGPGSLNSIALADVNSPPAILEDTSLVFSSAGGNAITVSDVDA